MLLSILRKMGWDELMASEKYVVIQALMTGWSDQPYDGFYNPGEFDHRMNEWGASGYEDMCSYICDTMDRLKPPCVYDGMGALFEKALNCKNANRFSLEALSGRIVRMREWWKDDKLCEIVNCCWDDLNGYGVIKRLHRPKDIVAHLMVVDKITLGSLNLLEVSNFIHIVNDAILAVGSDDNKQKAHMLLTHGLLTYTLDEFREHSHGAVISKIVKYNFTEDKVCTMRDIYNLVSKD